MAKLFSNKKLNNFKRSLRQNYRRVSYSRLLAYCFLAGITVCIFISVVTYFYLIFSGRAIGQTLPLIEQIKISFTAIVTYTGLLIGPVIQLMFYHINNTKLENDRISIGITYGQAFREKISHYSEIRKVTNSLDASSINIIKEARELIKCNDKNRYLLAHSRFGKVNLKNDTKAIFSEDFSVDLLSLYFFAFRAEITHGNDILARQFGLQNAASLPPVTCNKEMMGILLEMFNEVELIINISYSGNCDWEKIVEIANLDDIINDCRILYEALKSFNLAHGHNDFTLKYKYIESMIRQIIVTQTHCTHIQ